METENKRPEEEEYGRIQKKIAFLLLHTFCLNILTLLLALHIYLIK